MEMELEKSHRSTATAQRTVKCAFCRDQMPLAEALRGRGVCRLCRLEIAELSWRTIYDRDLRIGEIPSNLRQAYRL